MVIKVVGKGCMTCENMYQATKSVIEKHHLEAELVYVKDLKDIAKLGIMRTPALIVDNKVKASGRGLNAEEIEAILGL